MRNSCKILQILILAVSLAIFASCGAQTVTLNDLKVFPNAIEGVKIAELNSRINTAENLVGLDVEGKIGKFNSKTFTLPEETGFDLLQKFYDEEMKTQGFTPMFEKPVKSSDSQILYYQQKETKKAAIVFTQIENYETKKVYPFLTIYISK